MANPRSAKRDIDQKKRERAAGKRERRQKGGDSANGDSVDSVVTSSAVANDVLLGQLQKLHGAFEAGDIEFEAFEEAKAAIVAQLATG